MMRAVLAAAALAASVVGGVAPDRALAEGWSVYDLGPTSGRDACMNRARSTISRYIFRHGGGNTSEASWTVYGYDLTPGDQDAVIMCPQVSGGGIDAFLVVHGETREDERIFTADEIERLWKQ